MRFFFYGTLSHTLVPPVIAPVFRQGRFVARGKVRGRMFAGDRYPMGLFDPQAPSTISGRVFEFPEDDSLVRALDHYEGFEPTRPDSCLFIRETVTVDLDDGRSLPCWTYAYHREPDESIPIPHGDYERWLAESRADGREGPRCV